VTGPTSTTRSNGTTRDEGHPHEADSPEQPEPLVNDPG
jgi:hypothetical protein